MFTIKKSRMNADRNRYASEARIKRIIDASFACGVGSVLSVRGVGGHVYRSSRVSDAESIASDWRKVGNQLRMAIKNSI